MLPALSGRAKAYLALGRFLAVEGAVAVYALPDAGLLGRAKLVQDDFEAALTAHFARPVRVRLVLDDQGGSNHPPYPSPRGANGGAANGGAADGLAADGGVEEDDPSDYVLAEMEDVDAAVMSPEQRLLDAFPGAEEVAP